MLREVDVVVVGAGAAGLAAGSRLVRAGVSHVVLEARREIGGRAFTDLESFGGLPFDHGCHWLHSASVNPLRAEADRIGHAYRRQEGWGDRHAYIDGVAASAAELAGYERDFDAAIEAIHQAGVEGRDVAAASVVPTTSPFMPVIRLIFSLITSGEMEDVSTLDSARYRDTYEDWPVEDGLGALVARLAAGVSVERATPATAVDWSGPGVTVATPRGEIRAKAVVLAASTNVLSSGAIRFTPKLPDRLMEALHAVPIGCAEKVAFLLDAPLAELGDGHFISCHEPSSPGAPTLNFYCNQFGRPLVVAHLGGNPGRAVTEAGSAAMVDFATARLEKALGSAIRRRIRKTVATGWVTDPYVRGGYSYARPGMADLRRRLAEPVGERVFLAGEAVSQDFYSTAHGAHLTGIAAAEKALAVVGNRAAAL